MRCLPAVPRSFSKLDIDLNVIEVTADEIYSREMLELTQRTGAFDIVQYNSAWIGDYESYLQPLDDYVAKDNDAIGFADILPAFNKAQNLWGGKKYSVTLDGDTFLFYYRKDLFQDAGEKAAFKAKYGYDLPDPPKTWKQVEDIALPLYEGRMIGQFDFSQKGWVSGKGRKAEWQAAQPDTWCLASPGHGC